VIDEELDTLRTSPPEDREMTRALNQLEANFYRQMERVGGFGGKADQLNGYYTRTGMPDYFEEDLGRYRTLGGADIRSAIRRYLPKDKRVELSIVPEEKK
jgi:zinc protease